MKQKVTITVWACRCERCGHLWQTKTRDTPLTCPKCKSPYWDKPRKKNFAGHSLPSNKKRKN